MIQKISHKTSYCGYFIGFLSSGNKTRFGVLDIWKERRFWLLWWKNQGRLSEMIFALLLLVSPLRTTIWELKGKSQKFLHTSHSFFFSKSWPFPSKPWFKISFYRFVINQSCFTNLCERFRNYCQLLYWFRVHLSLKFWLLMFIGAAISHYLSAVALV